MDNGNDKNWKLLFRETFTYSDAICIEINSLYACWTNQKMHLAESLKSALEIKHHNDVTFLNIAIAGLDRIEKQ